MFLGFNTATFTASALKLGYPSAVRIFATTANFDGSVNVADRIADVRAQIEFYNAKGVSVFFSEKPKPADVISGVLDPYFIALGFMFKALGDEYGIQNYYTDWHEPENDIKTTAHPNNPIDSPGQFAEMLDHVHHVVHQVATDEYVEIGPVYMAFQWEDATKGEYKVLTPADWFPVKRDFVGADVYSDLYQKLKTKLSQHTGWLKILANSGDSAMFIVERGIKDHAQQATSLVADFGYLASLDNFVIGMLYWENTGDAGDWKLAADAADEWKSYNYLTSA